MLLRLIVLLLGVYVLPSLAVKDYLFKKCGQNGFCNRNRHFATQIAQQGVDYQPRYSIDVASLEVDDKAGTVTATVLKQLNDGSYVDLALELNVLENSNLRLQLDEVDRASKIGNNVSGLSLQRYNEASKWAFVKEPATIKFKHATTNDELVLQWSKDYDAVVKFFPLSITVSYKGEKQLILNERNLLNVEHYRTRDSEADPNSNDISPEESNYGAYKDSFKDTKSDTLKFGPESVALDVSFVGYSNVYGIPQHGDRLSLADTSNREPYRLFNVDIFEYPADASSYPMYGSIPFMIGAKPGSASGVFWVNSADTYVDIKKVAPEEDTRRIIHRKTAAEVQTHWMSENGVLDVILIIKDTPGEVSTAYGALTGYTTLPNIFSIGYHQSRWNYNDQKDVLEVAARFDENQIPCDAIWLDIEYTDDKKYFTWKPYAFSEPQSMVAELNKTGKNLIVIVDPHIKVGYDVSADLISRGLTIKESNGNTPYRGHSWPGESVFVDSLNPEAFTFWDTKFANGTALLGDSTNIHLWNDMDEPSIFNGQETTAAKDLVHYGGWEHRSIHNLYGLSFHEATYHALIARNPNKRPFILTRSFFPGSQRTSAMWTGDNMSKWEYLRASIYMSLSLNVAGFPFAGADVGGFFGDPNEELLVRWYQAAIWTPFFRAHAHIDTRRREPFLFKDPYLSYMRDAVRLRYKLLPELYTLFYRASQTGTPIMKPLFYDYPDNVETYNVDDEFIFGNLLVKPVMEEGRKNTEILLPDNEIYYSLQDPSQTLQGAGYHTVDAPLDTIPAYIRSGGIVTTRQRYRRSAKLMLQDPYTLYVALNSTGKATGELYIDDGETFSYEDGDYLDVSLKATGKSITSTIVGGSIDTPFTSSFGGVVERVVLLGYQATEATVIQDGETWTAEIVNGTVRNPRVAMNKPWEIRIA